METFVYQEFEVKQTGRTASKVLGSGRTVKTVEITPVDAMVGSWKKWVNPSDLFCLDITVQSSDDKESV